MKIPKIYYAPAHPLCRGCLFVCESGCCGNPVEAGLSDVEGVIRYLPKNAKGCKARIGRQKDARAMAGKYRTEES